MKALRICLVLLLIISGCKKEETPELITADISSISQTSAICGGEVISQGSSAVISKGICWSKSSDPTIQDSTTINGSGLGSFTSNLTKLNPGKKYFVRAYAINSSGAGYGEIKSFATNPSSLPTVITFIITSITKTTAKSGGMIYSDGASQIVDRGICWGTSENPTLSNNFISVGTGSDSINAIITGLTPYTDYFVRAYATNLVGTSYGNCRAFTTSFEANPAYPIDPDYPTFINKLNSDTLSKKRIAFAEKNIYLQSTLDSFGFCTYGALSVGYPPNFDNMTKEEAIETVKNFASKYPNETGVETPDELTFVSTDKLTIYDGIPSWNLQTACQKIDTIEVVNSYINFQVMNNEVIYCSGNWFPYIYIPKNFNINQEQAKSLLVNKVVKYEGWDEGYIIISQNDLNSCSFKLFIYQVRTDERIELRVTWQISITSISYILYMDVMTGEIVEGNSTLNF